jgi:putative transposase
MERTIDMAIEKEVLDQLLAGRDPQELLAKDGLLDELKRALSERMLSAELDDHLESEGAGGAINRRNGSSQRTVLYGIDVSPDLISTVTDAVLETVAEWQGRPLDACYPLVFFDAIRVKIRDEGFVRNKAVYIALGTLADGTKEILGIWIEQTEGDCHDFRVWLGIMGRKESPYVSTQRACDTERASRPVAGGRRCQRGI